MRDFDWLEPKTPRDACKMLADHGENARLLAGGTALMLALRQRLATPTHVIHLGGVPKLDRLEYRPRSGLRIGALTRIATIAAAPAVAQHYPMLADMAGRIANPQVRAAATLGGNLCYGDPATDPPTCLIALGASVVIVGRGGQRVLPLEAFYVDYFQTALAPDEIVTEIRVPPLAGGVGAYTRFLRTPAEHRPLVGLGVVAWQDRKRVCREARISIGAATPIPGRAPRAEAFLAGKTVTQAVLAEMAAIAAADIEPLDDLRGDAGYRRAMVEVVARRTAARAFGLAEEA